VFENPERPSVSDYATLNLPSRSFDKTAQFNAALGFHEVYCDKHWMILERGEIVLEFFPHADIDPLSSWFSCCLRFDHLDAFYALCKSAGLAEANTGYPRLHAPKDEAWGGRMGAMIDKDGTLLRLIQN
jgi:hypothetical protein